MRQTCQIRDTERESFPRNSVCLSRRVGGGEDGGGEDAGVVVLGDLDGDVVDICIAGAAEGGAIGGGLLVYSKAVPAAERKLVWSWR